MREKGRQDDQYSLFSYFQVYHADDRPGVSNLIEIHSALTGLDFNQIRDLARDMDTGQYKLYLADVVNDYIQPIRTKMQELSLNKDHVQDILKRGKLKASEIASQNLDEIKRIIGLK